MIFLNGRLIASAEARIDPADRGFLLGDGVFETLSCFAGRPFYLDDHLARLADGAGVLGIPSIPSAEQIIAAVFDTLAANDLAQRDAVVRITLSRGPGPRGLRPPDDPRPTLLVTATAMNQISDQPSHVVIARVRRNEHSPVSRFKTLNYLDNILAAREADAEGVEDALMRNTAGDLCCATAANLFLVKSGVLLTPPPEAGILPGITRAAVGKLAGSLGLAFQEAPTSLEELHASSEAFSTNSLVGIRPIAAVRGEQEWPDAPGPVTRRLQTAYRELVRDRAARA